MTTVHQLLPVFSYGDAIGNAALRTRAILRRLGYRSEIFAQSIDQRLATEARLITELDPARLGCDDAIVYRLSIGSALARVVELIPARRILVFHNITPHRYYERVSPEVTYWLERGEADLARLAPLVDLVIADSTFNFEVALEAGARRGVVIPPPIDFERLHPRPARPGQPPRLVFVGRLAPNKRHDILLRSLAVLRDAHGIDARLVIAGGADDTEIYLAALRRLAAELRLDGAVEVAGKRYRDADIGRLYAESNVFVSASEHEGLCVPLLEAMAFSVPVVARAAAAVPETVGDAGILIDDTDPFVYAGVIGRVIYDLPLRRKLIAAGHRRLASFSEPRIESLLSQALRGINVLP
jgi:glycosyltransferase involved in cell wall biosynthesis